MLNISKLGQVLLMTLHVHIYLLCKLKQTKTYLLSLLYFFVNYGLMVSLHAYVPWSSANAILTGNKSAQKVSEYDQEIPQSHTTDQPTAP